ncbi:hypothetical protein EDB80DRAFT_730826 [Ilyonectria destructans]|nr:hypothetical protein EDB80DRAFT_730826 [Ilyonectria destructans]
MPWRPPPVVDFDQQPEYRWPFWKVGLDEAALFGELHERFNTTRMFIQDPDAFHHDVNDIARHASDKADFLSRMQQRRDQRLDELKEIRENIFHFILSGHQRINDDQMFYYLRLNRFATLDCLVALCASFLGPDERGQVPSLDQFLLSDIHNLQKRQKFLPDRASRSPTPPSRALRVEYPELPPLPPSPERGSASSPDVDTEPKTPPFDRCDEGRSSVSKKKRSFQSWSNDEHQGKRRRTETLDPIKATVPEAAQGTENRCLAVTRARFAPIDPEKAPGGEMNPSLAPRDDGFDGRGNIHPEPEVQSSARGQSRRRVLKGSAWGATDCQLACDPGTQEEHKQERSVWEKRSLRARSRRPPSQLLVSTPKSSDRPEPTGLAGKSAT